MLHHLDLNVADLAVSAGFYAPLLSRLGYVRAESGRGWEVWRGVGAYLTLVQTAPEHLPAGFHRKRVGLNHLAFAAPSREAVDELHAWLLGRRVRVLYGGPNEMGTADAPNYVVALGATSTTLATWKFHVDFVTPANSTFTGPTALTVPTYIGDVRIGRGKITIYKTTP